MNEFQQASVDRLLSFIDAASIRLEAGEEQTAYSEDDGRFILVRQGGADMNWQLGKRVTERSIDYGQWFYIPPSCRYVLKPTAAGPVELVVIRFRQSSGALGFEPTSFRLPRALPWIQDFLHPPEQAQETHYFTQQSHLYAIAAAYGAAPRHPEAEQDLLHHLEMARRTLIELYDTPVDIEEIARLSGVSPSRFYQAFKRHTGLPPHKFVTAVRLNASLSLLANAPASIAEVAHTVGYADELYFSRVFKKHMGLSPTEFAARANRRIANLCPVFQGDFSVLGLSPVLQLPRDWPDQSEFAVTQVRDARPDLIFTFPVAEPLRAALESIAPVEMIAWKGAPWKDRLRAIGERLAVPSVADRWLQHFETKAANARYHVERVLGNTPFLLVSAYGDFFRVYGMQRIKMRDLFYDELGLTAPDASKDIGFLDTDRLEEVAALPCSNVVFLLPETLPESYGVQLEQQWNSLHAGGGLPPISLLIRHSDPLLYNAAFHEGLIDQMVNQLLSMEASRKSM